MMQDPELAYLESRVYTANPAELIQLLYEAALESIQQGIEAFGLGDIVARSRAITRATSCVMELAGSLNVAAGGELGVRLAVLYEYVLHQLLEANVRQDSGPLRDCERVVTSLLEGWTTALTQLDAPSTATASTEIQAPGASSPALDPEAISLQATGTLSLDWEKDSDDEEALQSTSKSWCG